MTFTDQQRKAYLQRHLSNALFEKLSRGEWHHVPVSESPRFKVYGAGTAPPIPGGVSYYSYAWLATVSPSIPRLLFPMHALFLDDLIYSEVLDDFAQGTRDNWRELLASGTNRLYHLQDNTMRRNSNAHPLMCAVAQALVQRLEEMKLIVPIEHNFDLALLESHEQQLVLAMLGKP